MRRRMLDISQTALADGLGISFQQVQKYENGSNRIGAGRLQHIASILQVPPTFFFDGQADLRPVAMRVAPFDYVTEFLATGDGLSLVKAFTRIKDAKVRRRIVGLVEEIAG